MTSLYCMTDLFTKKEEMSRVYIPGGGTGVTALQTAQHTVVAPRG